MPPTLAAIDALATDAITRRIFPGAVVLALHHGLPLHSAAYGTTMYDDPGTQPVQVGTVYDIASLTKLFTATAALQLVARGAIALDDPVARYLPGFAAQRITVRHLLTHTTGLEVRLASLRDMPPDGIRAHVYALQPVHAPGTRLAYVNVSTLLLGDLVQQVVGQPLDQVIAQGITVPLRLTQTGFVPPPAQRSQIAPTEHDDWRGGVVQGVAHDESAYALGGIAGHAGMFSTAADLGRFVQMWLQGGMLDGAVILPPELVAAAMQFQGAHLHLPPDIPFHCGLGWMLARHDYMGDAPPDTCGHTGFTGPVLLAIPSRQIGMVVLCNRTYPRRGERAHLGVVAAMLSAVLATA